MSTDFIVSFEPVSPDKRRGGYTAPCQACFQLDFTDPINPHFTATSFQRQREFGLVPDVNARRRRRRSPPPAPAAPGRRAASGADGSLAYGRSGTPRRWGTRWTPPGAGTWPGWSRCASSSREDDHVSQAPAGCCSRGELNLTSHLVARTWQTRRAAGRPRGASRRTPSSPLRGGQEVPRDIVQVQVDCRFGAIKRAANRTGRARLPPGRVTTDISRHSRERNLRRLRKLVFYRLRSRGLSPSRLILLSRPPGERLTVLIDHHRSRGLCPCACMYEIRHVNFKMIYGRSVPALKAVPWELRSLAAKGRGIETFRSSFLQNLILPTLGI